MSTTLTPSSARAQQAIARGEPVVGSPLRWAGDMAAMGGLGMLTLSLMGGGGAALDRVLLLTGSGAVGGALLGVGLALALERLRGRLPLPIIFLLGTASTAAWAIFSLSVVFGFLADPYPRLVWDLVTFGSLIGVGLLGWLWFAYTVFSVLRLPRWPLVALTVPWAGLLWIFLRILTT